MGLSAAFKHCCGYAYPSQGSVLRGQLAFRDKLLFVHDLGVGDELDAVQASLLSSARQPQFPQDIQRQKHTAVSWN